MDKRILFFSKSKIKNNYKYVISVALKYKTKSLIAENLSQVFDKVKTAKIITYGQSDIKDIMRFSSLITRKDLIFCPLENLEKALSDYHHSQEILQLIKADISAFLDYINLPIIHTGNILIKYTLYYIRINNIKACNYKILKHISKKLSLSWDKEIVSLRRTLKDWCQDNCYISQFNKKTKTFNTLTTLDEIYKLYKSNIHKNININDYNFQHKFNSLHSKDCELINKAFVKCS